MDREPIAVEVEHPEDNSLMKFTKGSRKVEDVKHNRESVALKKETETVVFPIHRVFRVFYK